MRIFISLVNYYGSFLPMLNKKIPSKSQFIQNIALKNKPLKTSHI